MVDSCEKVMEERKKMRKKILSFIINDEIN